MRSLALFALAIFALAPITHGASARIIKVLPQYLDLKGRNSLHPSLFERDAYQAELRANPDKRSALRFDVNWKAPWYEYGALKVRVEVKGMKGRQPKQLALEQSVKSTTMFSEWTGVTLSGEHFQGFEMISWRALLMNGTNVIAEQKSFLW
jgi:hypothetical protein